MAKERICKICHENEATCPDRYYNNIGRLKLEICTGCHSAQLRGDMAYIMGVYKRRKEAVGIESR